MTADTSDGTREPRLNPFVFPPDTDLRFVLLVVSVLGASLFAYNWLYYEISGSALQETLRGCLPLVEGTLDGVRGAARYLSFEKCVETAERAQAIWIFSGVALLVALSGLIYGSIPALKIRRSRLVPLTDERAPGVAAYLEELYLEAGLSRPPTILVDPRNASVSGLAFGRVGKRYVSLNAGLVMKFYTGRPTFRAIVLHELAHLRNADVDKTYLSVSVGLAFAVAALAPLAVNLIYDLVRLEDPWTIFGLFWRILALAALVYMTLAAVLRAREMYADVRASGWDGHSGALEQALGSLSPPKRGRLRALLRVHPNPETRRQTLIETDGLFRMGFWDAFGTGVAAMVAAPILAFVLGLAFPSRQETWTPVVAALIFAPLAVGVVWLGVWRGVFAALVRGRSPRGVIRLALALGLGVMLGQALALDSVVTSSLTTADAAGRMASVAFDLVLGAVLLVVLSCFLWWVSACASAWLGEITTRHSLRLVVLLGLIVTGLVATVLLGSMLWLFSTGSSALVLLAAPNLAAVILTILQFPPTLLTLACLWAFPLAARFWRTTQTGDTQWAFLDPSSHPLTLRSQDRFRLSRSALTGVVGGLVFCGLLLVVHFAWNTVPEDARTTFLARNLFAAGQVLAAVLIQAIVASIVAIRLRWLGGIHGLFAAFVGGCVMTGGILVLNLAFGGGITLPFAWSMFGFVVNGGALLSLPVAATISILKEQFGRDSHPTGDHDRPRFPPGTVNPERSSTMTEDDNPRFCSQCGSRVKAGTSFCEACGARVTGGPRGAPPRDYSPSRTSASGGNRTLVMIGGIGAVLVLLLVASTIIGLTLLGNRPGEQPASVPLPRQQGSSAEPAASGTASARLDENLTVGDSVESGGTRTTLRGVRILPTTNLDQPAQSPDNMFVAVELAFENISGQPVNVQTSVEFALENGEGYSARQANHTRQLQMADGQISAGESKGGELVYEVLPDSSGLRLVRNSLGGVTNTWYIGDLEAVPGSAQTASSSASPASGPTSASPAPEQAPLVSEAGVVEAAEDYYQAVDREDWAYTYENLDSGTRDMFVEDEWYQKNQWIADTEDLKLAYMDIAVNDPPSDLAAGVTVYRTFESGSTITRDTFFVYEDGSWKHQFSQEEVEIFMPGTPFEEFVAAQ